MTKHNINNCKVCGSKNTFGMSRVVGYLSVIENWNESKQAELIDRQRGNYNIIDTREVIKVTQ